MLHNPFDQIDTPFDRQNTFSSRPFGTPGRKRCKESIFALAGQALLRKNAPRTAHVAAADYTWSGCGPSKPPGVSRLPYTLCCTIHLENRYTENRYTLERKRMLHIIFCNIPLFFYFDFTIILPSRTSRKARPAPARCGGAGSAGYNPRDNASRSAWPVPASSGA